MRGIKKVRLVVKVKHFVRLNTIANHPICRRSDFVIVLVRKAEVFLVVYKYSVLFITRLKNFLRPDSFPFANNIKSVSNRLGCVSLK